MGRVIDSDEGYSDDGYPPLFRLRDRLKALGVNTDYWSSRESNSVVVANDDSLTSEEFRGRHSQLHRDLASTLIDREWESDEIDNAFRKDPQPFHCQVLLVAGDLLFQRGRSIDALKAYALAVDVAPSPQAQLEMGYLLGLRGGARLPFSWSAFSQALVLRPGDEEDFEGLPRYQVICDDLLPKLDFESFQPSDVLRLALEAYGRVFGFYLDEARQATDDKPADEGDMWIQPLVLDGIGVLLNSLGEEAFELIWNAFRSWRDVVSDWVPEVVANRLLGWRAHVEGEELGRAKERQLYEAIRQLDRERQSTQVIRDPDKLVEKLEEAAARWAVPRTTKAEIERDWASRVGDVWMNLVDVVRYEIIEGEWFRGVIEREDGSDYWPVALSYGKAIEALLCEITRSERLLHQFGKMMATQDASLLRFFRAGAPFDGLASMVDKVARARNQAAHNNRGVYRRTDPGTIRELSEIIGGSADKEGLLALLVKWRSP